MKKIGFSLSAVAFALALNGSAQAYERTALPRDRTSVEYAGPITSVLKVIVGPKWLGQTPEMNGGVVFKSHHNQFFGKEDTPLGKGIMVDATFYTYDNVSKEVVLTARKSEIEGFVELYSMENNEFQMHIKVINSSEIQVFNSAYDYQNPEKLYTYKKVDSFNKNPHKDKIRSAKEDGTVF